jgi:hypothetical protein
VNVVEQIDEMFLPFSSLSDDTSKCICEKLISEFVQNELKPQLCHVFSDELSKMEWGTSKSLLVEPEGLVSVIAACKHLFHLQKQCKLNISSFSSNTSSWCAEIYFAAFEVRFNYHFYGDRKTNRIDKPEFYYSWVISQINEFSPFLLKNFDFLETPVTDFINKFIDLATKKTVKHLDKVKSCNSDDLRHLFIHLINESIHFQKSLFEISQNSTNLLEFIVSDSIVFDQWLAMDKNSIKSDFDWTLYSSEFMITNSAHTFIHTVNSMNERYKLLPKDKKQILIKNINVVYFETFLKALKKQSTVTLSNRYTEELKKYCWVLNSAYYCENCLREMEELNDNESPLRGYIDDFSLTYNSMIRSLIDHMMDTFKREFVNTYKKTLDITPIAKNIHDKLIVIQSNTETHFLIIWRNLASDLDKFLSIQKNLIRQDIETVGTIIFGDFTTKPNKFLPTSNK